MNRGIFEFTIERLRITCFKDAVGLAVLILLVPVVMAIVVTTMSDFRPPEEMARALFTVYDNPIVQLLLAFCFVSEAPMSARALGDVEPMCLVFSRPVNRFNYVITRLVAATLGSAGLLLASAIVFQIVAYSVNADVFLLDGYAILSIILNTLIHAALVVMLHCVRAPFGFVAFVMAHFVLTFGEALARAPLSSVPMWARVVTTAFVVSSDWLYDFLHLEIDVYTLINGIAFNWLTLLTYSSNLVLFIWLGAYFLSKREFFYGTD